MAFDRNKWKAASLKANQETTKEAEKLTSKGNNFDRPGFHSIDDGTNIFRICPPHDAEDPSFQPVCVAKIPLEVDETDKDGKATGKKVIKNKKKYIKKH